MAAEEADVMPAPPAPPPIPIVYNCSVCLEDLPPSALCTTLKCSCCVCQHCMVSHLTLRINDGAVDSFPCPACQVPLDIDQVKSLVDVSIHERLDRLVLAEQMNRKVQSDPTLRWCPGPDCNTIVKRLDPAERAMTCTKCNTVFCFDCAGPAHGTQTCDSARQGRAKKEGDTERQFMSWAKGSAKRCPNPACRTLIERAKDSGSADCNHMTCSRCKTEFCWLCGRKVPPIGHFDVTNVLGCPGLQYSGPDVEATRRMRARCFACCLQTKAGCIKGGIYAGVGLLAIAALPFIVVGWLPYILIRKYRRR